MVVRTVTELVGLAARVVGVRVRHVIKRRRMNMYSSNPPVR
jgi:hypothetical protein